jgi:YegS/Rv2252/BmrU family lipid kinase
VEIQGLRSSKSKPVVATRIILHGKAAGNASVRTAVRAVRQNSYPVEVRVTWEPGDAARLTAEAVADAGAGKVTCIVAGGGDGTINEVFATAYGAGLPVQCSLGILPLGTANDFAHATGVPVQDLTAALQFATGTPPRWIDMGLLNDRPFINLVSGGFGSRVTVETDPELKDIRRNK